MKTEKLKFPVIKNKLAAPKALSMNDYLRFVSFNVKHVFNKKAYRDWKKASAVDVPFIFKN